MNSFDAARVETVLVDSYSTLVDMRSLEDALAEYTEKAREAATIWFQRSKIYGITATQFDEFRPCREKYRHSLNYALQSVGASVSPTDQEDILTALDRLTVFDDVRTGLKRLTDHGYEVYVLSNGGLDMLATLIDHAEIDDIISETVSASEIGLYKPDQRLYRHAAVRTETPITGLAHVTASWNDVHGAMQSGMQGVWLNRRGTEWEAFLDEPHLTVESFHEFGDILNVESNN
ncbi:HAD family hydrolase [Haladaptatus caseinilyticus]|uniref:HAD family hydrolase n=1 Tax=Haladaptatus caseinilyticus TaxID=2993314 RepID=UPI00224B3B0F|nr:HAD family hydrolase [Haladaptatus caseinilyticus]